MAGAWLALTAAQLALVQWQNLLWGFQSQFEFVVIGALTSIIISIILAERTPFAPLLSASLYFAVGFCIFSMGNGVAIPAFVLFVFQACKTQRKRANAFCLVSGAYLLVFKLLTSGSSPVGDPTLKTSENIVKFFFVMMGGPITSTIDNAMIFGIILFYVCLLLFVATILLPFMRSRKVDHGLIGIFAFVGFLIATAAAATWARVSLGAPAALASRYATPMLLLWMSCICVIARLWMIRDRPHPWRQAIFQACILAASGVTVWADVRPDIAAQVTAFSSPIEQAAYFVASDALTDAQLVQLYPHPSQIKTPLALVRAHGMNLFAPAMGLRVPNAADVQAMIRVSPSAFCSTAAIDSIAHLGANVWVASGWVADDRLRTPRWILAVNADNQLKGFTPPLTPRPDVVAAVHAEAGFKGFVLPIHLTGPSKSTVSIVVISKDGSQACRVRNVSALSEGLIPAVPQPLQPVEVRVSVKGAVASTGTPPGVRIASPYPGAKILGTWVSSDEDTGEITLEIPDPDCRGFLLPVLRGPSAAGQILEIRYPGGENEQNTLDSLQPHTWGFFQIASSAACKPSPISSVTVILKDAGRDWGAWSAVAMPGHPR